MSGRGLKFIGAGALCVVFAVITRWCATSDQDVKADAAFRDRAIDSSQHDAPPAVGGSFSPTTDGRSTVDDVPLGPPTSDAAPDGVAKSASERFVLGSPSPQFERALRPIVKEAFGEERYVLECRGTVCRVAQPDGATPSVEWANKLLDPGTGAGTFTGGEAYGGASIVVYLEMAQTDEFRFLSAVATRMYDESFAAECKSKHPQPGELSVGVSLDSTRRLSFALQGSLRGTPFASCVRARLDALVSELPVPADVAKLEEFEVIFTAP